MTDLYANFVFGTTTAAVAATDTTVVVDDVTSFPTNTTLATGSFWLTFESSLTHPNTFEIVQLTNVNTSTKTLTVVRAQESTTAAAHPVGTVVKGALTAGMLGRAAGPDTTAAHPRGAWNAGSSYAVNDLVTYQSGLYVCTTAVAAGAPPAVVGSPTTFSPAGTSGTNAGGNITLPTGSASGQLCVLVLTKLKSTSNTGNTLVAPVGFSQVYNDQVFGSSSVWYNESGIYTKVLTATDISNGYITIPTQVTDSNTRLEAICYTLSNAVAGAASANKSASGTSISTPSITPAGTGLLLSAATGASNGALTLPSGVTNTVTENVSGWFVMGAGVESVNAGVSTTARTFSGFSSGGGLIAVALEIDPSGTFPTTSFTEVAILGNLRATATATTVSLASGASDSSTPIAMSKGFVLYSIQTSRPARVELYSTAAAMSADASRGVGVDPASSAGVILDYVTTDNSVHSLSPTVTGSNLESAPSANISMRVTNNDTVTGTVTVTLVWLKLE